VNETWILSLLVTRGMVSNLIDLEELAAKSLGCDEHDLLAKFFQPITAMIWKYWGIEQSNDEVHLIQVQYRLSRVVTSNSRC
jgi:hypothetical protein